MTDREINAFAKNRAEELGFDLWGEFVVPPFFHNLALDEVRKPLVIEGGRGCGKTTLLRYLSHQTQLSPRRALTKVPGKVGFYLRADTQFLRTFRGDTLPEDQWLKVFEHALCLMILGEFFSALELLGRGPDRHTLFPGIHDLRLKCLADFVEDAPERIPDLVEWLSSQRNKLAFWLQNSDRLSCPFLLPLKQVLLACIRAVHEKIPVLSQTDFFVFIDEYENLLPYQMKLINTFLKHSEPPLIFHVAVKRNAMTERSTIGVEQLQEPDDYRTVDIEDDLTEQFELFAAELFCFRLLRKGVVLKDCPVTPEALCDETKVATRFNDADYASAVRAVVTSYLPNVSNEQIARFVFDDPTLRSHLEKEFKKVLDNVDRSIQPAAFMRPEVAMASISCLPLLHQGKRANELLEELDRLAKADPTFPSRFRTTDWIHHYFLGAVLYLFLPLQRPCLAYAGFASFLKLSRYNVRHFLELCHVSMQSKDDRNAQGSVTPAAQAQAARNASAMFVKETQGSGDHGNRLYLIVNTLGQIFRLSQQRPSQSEPEKTHFSIVNDVPDEEAQSILRECVKWSVLIASRETKIKDARLETNEYIFNPIYAPYFGISPNKGRRLELSATLAKALLVGQRDELDELVRHFKKAWGVAEADQLSMFN